MFLDGPPGHEPEGRVQVGDAIHMDLMLQPNEVCGRMLLALRGMSGKCGGKEDALFGK